MSPANGDRNLLFGVLALQMDFINRDALVKAMHAWVLDKSKPLGQILTEQGALSESRRALLEPLVQEHIHQHGDDAGRSLAAVSSVGSAREELKRIADPDVQASLVNLPTTDPNLTKYPTAGETSAVGRRFLILRPHAEGGLGKVSVALDGELNREVALKEIHEQYADHTESRSRFLLEAEITGGLEHPSIVPVYGLGQYEDGRPFYAMRFIRGDSLKEAIERFHKTTGPINAGKRALELRQLLGRFNDVCDAVAYAHSRGVLHRDLKPGNVMLGKYGETLVVDWGLAKPTGAATKQEDNAESPLQPSADGSAPTQMGSAIGTPQFMPPEQAAGRLDQMGPASDVYSLGATLYCLLTGKPPFTDREVGVVLQKVQRGDFPRPRQVRREIPPALEAICLKAMALRPADRYATPRALAGDVEKWLADEPVSAYREPWRIRAGRWARRNQTLVAATAAGVLVAILAGGAGALWYQHDRSMRAAERASKAAATERDVTAALDEAATLGKQAATLTNDPVHWEATLSEALSAVKRAEGLLNSGEATDQLRGIVAAQRQELEAADKDRRMIARLEDVRMQYYFSENETGPDKAGAVAAYTAAFDNYMQLNSLTPEQAADAINKRPIRVELLDSLSLWAFLTHNPERDIEELMALLPGGNKTKVRPNKEQERLESILKAAGTDTGSYRSRLVEAAARGEMNRVRDIAFTPEVANLPAAELALMGSAMINTTPNDAVKFLKQANERRPGNFWIVFELATACGSISPPQTDDAIRYYTAALALRPNESGSHNLLGNSLLHKGQREEAVNEFRTAIRLDPKSAYPHANLGLVHNLEGKLAPAEEEYRKAIELNPKNVSAHGRLGDILMAQANPEEAAIEYRKAIDIEEKNNADVFNFAYSFIGRSIGHKGLGQFFLMKDQPLLAEDEFRNAVSLAPNNPEFQMNLGTAVLIQGRITEAKEIYQRGLELLPADNKQRQVVSNIVRLCEQMALLDKKLPDILAGKAKASNAALQISLARVCKYKDRHSDAARFFADAFAAQPALAEDLSSTNRFTAACAAVLAADRGNGGDKLSDQDSARLRQQALGWLRSDFVLLSKQAESTNPQAIMNTRVKLKIWQINIDLASVRDAAALEKLPESERAEWKKLWADVAELLKKSESKK